VAGVALLLGWMKRFVLNLLLLLIVFFTFLTAYALFSKNPDGSPKFTNCGCFGDCLPIPPVASFTKDLVLLALIVFLIAGRKYIAPFFSRGVQTAVMLFSLIASLGLQWYALNYLPPVDCLPFKVKNNIPEKMKIPAGAVPDSVALRFIYEKGGKKYEFSPENFPPDLGSYKFIDRTDKLIRKGNAEAPIKGFTLNAGNMDSTEIVLSQPASLLLFCLSLDGASSWMKDIKEVHAVAKARQIPLYIVTAAPLQQISAALISNGLGDVQAFNTDNTVVRTATRTNPTLYYLEKGTIISKYSRMNIKDAAADLKNR
jgi:hypothetical protein